MDVSWLAELKDVLLTEKFLALKSFLEEEKAAKQIVYPKDNDIYSWLVVPHTHKITLLELRETCLLTLFWNSSGPDIVLFTK